MAGAAKSRQGPLHVRLHDLAFLHPDISQYGRRATMSDHPSQWLFDVAFLQAGIAKIIYGAARCASVWAKRLSL